MANDRIATPQEKNEFMVQMAIDRQLKKGYLKLVGTDSNGKKSYALTDKGKKYFKKTFQIDPK